jgi:hypothetical protein
MPSTVGRFAGFEVDLRAGQLRRKGARIRLQEQPFQAGLRELRDRQALPPPFTGLLASVRMQVSLDFRLSFNCGGLRSPAQMHCQTSNATPSEIARRRPLRHSSQLDEHECIRYGWNLRRRSP